MGLETSPTRTPQKAVVAPASARAHRPGRLRGEGGAQGIGRRRHFCFPRFPARTRM